MSFTKPMRALSALVLSCSALAAQASVQLLTSPSDITTTYLVDFESTINTPEIVFSSAAAFGTASSWTTNVTPSGMQGLSQSRLNGPLTATFNAPVRQAGFYFGNDDFGLDFAVEVTAYGASGVLGTVSLSVNRNDHADQFIGLQSDSLITQISIAYQRPQAEELSVYIDDFRVGAVPEPSTWLLGSLGVAGMLLSRRRRA
jgi:hypothetical protein